ncbi:peptidoglycan-binding protein [Actinomycetospora termitidis]|uniref:GDSL-type esterase/lipase family protein n=1 Tax=Actinomycetospora termitidis TaxID=3053470 RepID=A0ABT7MHZ9_9PSEU|nr:peptidoglycan-binding protein [Actinomycetospora sp. Odt1-22]MDL5158953.1 GDSL-type esterase/lipase family protein [Actinomycetospora sp. Odt1-22]
MALLVVAGIAGSPVGVGEAQVAPPIPAESIGPESTDADAVACIQRALDVDTGGAPLGTYGARTTAAVRAFQEASGLPPIGRVGPATGALLADRAPVGCADLLPSESSVVAAPSAEESRSYSDCPLLIEGMRHECVRRLQNDLNAVEPSHALPGTDFFGPATRTAVLDFQGQNRLAADGNVGGEVADLLARQAASARGSGSGSEAAPSQTGQGAGAAETAEMPETPAPTRYAALGDSFASGEGAPEAGRTYLPGTNENDNLCHRSDNAYGVEVGRALDMPTDFVACSGAVLNDYDASQQGRAGQEAQRGAVGPDTKLVTMTFGGNDIAFSKIATDCAGAKLDPRRDTWAANCADAVDEATKSVAGRISGPYEQLLADVQKRAPEARILVVGYPRMFPDAPDEQCATGVLRAPGIPGISFQIKEMTRINTLVSTLNQQIRQTAEAAGPRVSFVNVERALEGHDACSSDRWINLANYPASTSVKNESFHPTVAGQAAMRDRVLACVREPGSC